MCLPLTPTMTWKHRAQMRQTNISKRVYSFLSSPGAWPTGSPSSPNLISGGIRTCTLVPLKQPYRGSGSYPCPFQSKESALPSPVFTPKLNWILTYTLYFKMLKDGCLIHTVTFNLGLWMPTRQWPSPATAILLLIPSSKLPVQASELR